MSYNEILLHYGFFLKKRQIVSKINMLVLVFFNPLANVSMIWEIYHRRWSVANIVLCLVLIALCDTGHVLYQNNQPLWIFWFYFRPNLSWSNFTLIRLPNTRVLRRELFHTMSSELSGGQMSHLKWNVPWMFFWIHRSNLW